MQGNKGFWNPSALKPKYKSALTKADIMNSVKRSFGENEKAFFTFRLHVIFSISRVVVLTRTTAVNFLVSNSTGQTLPYKKTRLVFKLPL
jgi:hypothetical protein